MALTAASLTDNKDILLMLSDMDINAIAGTLKLYFRELPEPLLTDRLYPAFMEGIGEALGQHNQEQGASSAVVSPAHTGQACWGPRRVWCGPPPQCPRGCVETQHPKHLP